MHNPLRLTRGQLARETGVNSETIRYYEKSGLLSAPDRTAGGHRVYDKRDVGALNFVKRARELGFSPKEVRAILQLQFQAEAPCAKAKDIAATHLEQVRAKIADLREIEALLGKTIAGCEDDAAGKCPVLELLESN